MPRTIHFEIHASDPERGQEFYRRLFGWQFQKWAGPMEYWPVTTNPDEEPGIMAAVAPAGAAGGGGTGGERLRLYHGGGLPGQGARNRRRAWDGSPT